MVVTIVEEKGNLN